MQLKTVVLPAPLGPIKPTISNSSTLMLTSLSACSPPKRMEMLSVSRTCMHALRSGSAAGSMHRERAALQPATERRGERSESFRLEDQGEDGQHSRQQLDVVAGVDLDVVDTDALGEFGEPVEAEGVEDGEEHDATAAAQPTHDGNDENGQGDAGEAEVDGLHSEAPRREQSTGDAGIEAADGEGEQRVGLHV